MLITKFWKWFAGYDLINNWVGPRILKVILEKDGISFTNYAERMQIEVKGHFYVALSH
jgi:hypothetical protein